MQLNYKQSVDNWLWGSIIWWMIILGLIVIYAGITENPLIIGLSVLESILITTLISNLITKHLKRLQTGMQNLSTNKTFKPLPLAGPIEIRQLIKSFNQMAQVIVSSNANLEQQLEKRSAELKAFKDNSTQLLRRLTAILESTEEPLIAINQASEVIIFNGAVAGLTGFSAQQVIGKPVSKLLNFKDKQMNPLATNESPLFQARHSLKTVVRDGDDYLFVTNKHGGHVPVTVTASPVMGPYQQVLGAVCVLKDVSVEKRLRELQNEFVFVAAHELRNPVSAIAGYLEMANEVKSRSEKLNTALSAIGLANMRLARLTNELLQVAKSEAGRINPKLRATRISRAVNQVLNENLKAAKEVRVKLIYKVTKVQEYLKVSADKDLLHEVLDNLINNAIKYTVKGSVRISHFLSRKANHITAVSKNEAKYLVTEIKDTGIGIPKDEQSKVFEKFFRGSNLEAEMEGNGLGNFIVKQLVEKMGGRIWFESEEGKGTTFYFSLPLRQDWNESKI